MIGIVFSLIHLGEQLVDNVHKIIQTEQGIRRAEERKANGTDNTNTYFDWRGARRDLNTNELRHVDFAIAENDGQDQCIRDMYGNVVRNLTQEKRDGREEASIRSGRTVYLYREYANGIYNGAEHRDFGGDGLCEGSQYKDLRTGAVYVARRVPMKGVGTPSVPCYMDLSGRFIREADSVELNRKNGTITSSKEEVIEAMAELNKGRIRPTPMLDAFGKPRYNDGLYKSQMGKYYLNKNAVKGDV